MALQKHLRDAGGAAKVAIDLERWMRVEQVGVRAATVRHVEAEFASRSEQRREQLVRTIAVTQARPEVDAPGERPAGAVVAAGVEEFAAGARQFGRVVQGDLVVRMESVHRRGVPMGRLKFGIRFKPFLQTAVGTYLIRREPGAFQGQFTAQVGVHTKGFGGGDSIGEEFAQQLHFKGRTETDVRALTVGQAERIFRRVRWARDEPVPFGFHDEVVEVEQSGFFQDRVRPA